MHDRTVAVGAALTASAVAAGWSARLAGLAALVVATAIAATAIPSRRPFAARPGVSMLLLVLVVLGGWRSDLAWEALEPRRLGPYEGWVQVVDDPQPTRGAIRVIVEVRGQRFETWHRGRAAELRAQTWRAGERVHLNGERVRLDDDRRARVAWQHVVGELEIEWAGDVVDGRPVDRASNRVRAAIERGASALPGDDGALFRGLVVGDDRDQPFEMIARFRASGLSHLTAVSGQNVALVLAAAGPLLVRLRPVWRWAVTVALIAWFVSLTRFEPSIVRAGVMAGLSATGFVLGRERSPFRLLCWAVIALLVIDPLLAWSVGFWLSVGATTGVTTIGPWLAARLNGFGSFAMPLAITLGAQAGVVVPAMLVFGRLPLMSVPANLAAVPVASFVMLYGLPAGLAAGWVPALAPIVMFPCRIGVRWVDTVAVVAARVEPEPTIAWMGWAGLVVTVGVIAAMNWGRHGSTPADR